MPYRRHITRTIPETFLFNLRFVEFCQCQGDRMKYVDLPKFLFEAHPRFLPLLFPLVRFCFFVLRGNKILRKPYILYQSRTVCVLLSRITPWANEGATRRRPQEEISLGKNPSHESNCRQNIQSNTLQGPGTECQGRPKQCTLKKEF